MVASAHPFIITSLASSIKGEWSVEGDEVVWQRLDISQWIIAIHSIKSTKVAVHLGVRAPTDFCLLSPSRAHRPGTTGHMSRRSYRQLRKLNTQIAHNAAYTFNFLSVSSQVLSRYIGYFMLQVTSMLSFACTVCTPSCCRFRNPSHPFKAPPAARHVGGWRCHCHWWTPPGRRRRCTFPSFQIPLNKEGLPVASSIATPKCWLLLEICGVSQCHLARTIRKLRPAESSGQLSASHKPNRSGSWSHHNKVMQSYEELLRPPAAMEPLKLAAVEWQRSSQRLLPPAGCRALEIICCTKPGVATTSTTSASLIPHSSGIQCRLKTL